MSDTPNPHGLLNFTQSSKDGKQIDYLYFPDSAKSIEDAKVYLSYNGATDTLTLKAKNIVFETDSLSVSKTKS